MSNVFREEQFAASHLLYRKHIGDDKGLSHKDVRIALSKNKVFSKNQYCSADVLQFCIDQKFLQWHGNVLDFGCRDAGLFHIMHDLHPKAKYFGCDIKLVCEETDWLEVWQTEPDPPLPFKPDTFQSIVAFSVFSHLTLGSMTEWLLELRRVLVPGGRLFFTYCELRSIEVLADRHNWTIEKTADLIMRAQRDNFVWEDIYEKDLLKNHFAGSEHYGLTFIHNVTKVCPEGLEGKALLPGRSGHQSVCIMEKN